jgi:hypothetical protein
MIIQQIRRWLALADYEDSKVESSNRILSRYSRGNVMLQRGAFITSNELRSKSRSADSSMRVIQKAAERSN